MDAVHGKPGTHLGEIENPDGEGEHGSIACGDALRFTFRVDRHPEDATKDVIVAVRYLTFGCTSAIAASEALCRLIENKRLTPIDALKITNQDIVEYLDGLPEQKIHCSVMGAEALEAAGFNWAQKRELDLKKLGVDIHATEQEEGRIVCKCFTMSEPYLRRKIKELHLRTITEITGAVKAGGACMSCHHASGGLQDILDDIWKNEKPPETLPLELPVLGANIQCVPTLPQEPLVPKTDAGTGTPQNLSPFQFAKKVEKVLYEYIRPMLRRDGGDIEIIDIKGVNVYVELRGACVGCASAGQTLKMMVERSLKEQIDERIKVIQV